ncbi:GIY-YIG nuclease family protein [Planktothrix sp. FACHB-1355]|uniref:GIY-YIG nuclease family protein n=2 Tax=Aerosakkonema funiforme TaxID=1246630 RepID=A0A926VK98_9CYAN|nr:GIY-YIG nuclease family protein [Planktothrix sp. FACHB-1355]MBD2184803.1 GIY-YIG nuclease family protein [Aerosakkonema funiforme FACHB-1375]MBD3557451.1 GIY-YIG nuclease family protein [Planktothrix sp. FACHB-1355]
MWLRYGVSPDKTLVSIEDVPSGKTQLRCPYCDGELTAKKGRRKEHHFAHTNETCREVDRDSRSVPYLPLYDNFNIWLTGKELQQLKDLWNRYRIKDKGIHESLVPKILIKEKLLERNTYRYGGEYQFTKLGKIPVGALSLLLFNQVQEPMLLEKLQQLENLAQTAYLENSPLFNQQLRDLQIYRAEFRKILANTLYYLQVDTGETTIYKIGVTQRNLSERLVEIERDLRSHFQSFSVKVLGEWPHRGNVEKYFKHRYSFFQTKIGDLTEYFAFPDKEAKTVLRDLRRMEPKSLSKIEVGILAGEPSQTENLIAERELANRRSQAIKTGMERAKNWGQHVGRPPVGESALEFLAKPSSQKVIQALSQGLSLRSSAEQAGVAVNTVRKVQKCIKTENPQNSRLINTEFIT